jgi:hypothetical protein
MILQIKLNIKKRLRDRSAGGGPRRRALISAKFFAELCGDALQFAGQKSLLSALSRPADGGSRPVA